MLGRIDKRLIRRAVKIRSIGIRLRWRVTPLLFTEGGGRANQYAKIQRAYALENAPDQVQLHHCEQYEDPSSRKLDDVPLPEGLTYEEYFEYAYVNVSEHRFCHWHAVPWLRNLFRKDG